MLKKEITLGSLIAILLTMGMAVFTWGVSISTRLEGSDVRIENVEEKSNKNTVDIERVESEAKQDRKDTQYKLDRIIELVNDNK